jgi:hypothetical protein
MALRVERVIWAAEDGTEFDTESEAMEYEQNHLMDPYVSIAQKADSLIQTDDYDADRSYICKDDLISWMKTYFEIKHKKETET